VCLRLRWSLECRGRYLRPRGTREGDWRKISETERDEGMGLEEDMRLRATREGNCRRISDIERDEGMGLEEDI